MPGRWSARPPFETQSLEDRTSQSTRAFEGLTEMWQVAAVVEDQDEQRWLAAARLGMFLARAAHRRVDLSVQWQAEMDRGTHNAVVKLQSIRCPWPSCCPSKEKEQQEPHRCVRQETLRRTAGVSAPCCWSPCSGRQETLLRGQELPTGGRSRSTGAGVVARGAGDPGRRQEPMRRVAGRCAGRLEPLHCSWVRAQGIRRWSARPPFDTQRLEDRTSQSTRACEGLTQMWQWIAVVEDQEKEQPASLRAAGDIAPCGRRHCAVWQETLQEDTVGDVAAGGRSPPRAERQAAEATTMGGRTLRRAAGAAAPDGKSLCARRQELRSVGRQYTLRRAAGDTVANGKRPCSGPQEPPLRGATGDCALCGRSCAVRQGSKSRCGRRQDVAAGGRTRCCERQKLPNRRQEPHHRGRIRCLGSAAGDTIGVAGKEPMHRAASVIVPDGSRFCRWQEPLHRNGMSHCTGWQEPLRRCGWSPGAGRQEPPLRQAEGDAAPRQKLLALEILLRAAGTVAPGGRRHCANSRAHAPATGAAALGRNKTCGRSRCTGSEEPPRRAAGHTVGDVAAGGRRRCCKRRVPLRWQQQPGRSRCGRQDPL